VRTLFSIVSTNPGLRFEDTIFQQTAPPGCPQFLCKIFKPWSKLVHLYMASVLLNRRCTTLLRGSPPLQCPRIIEVASHVILSVVHLFGDDERLVDYFDSDFHCYHQSHH